MTQDSPIRATGKEHLIELIGRAIKTNGPNCDLNHLDVSGVSDFSEVFLGFPTFNGNISRWDVSGATTMESMFENSQFNGDLSRWDVSQVRSMEHMFSNSKFNQSLAAWDVGRVLTMHGMFQNSPFNQPIEDWNVGNVLRFTAMFAKSKFAQPLAKWRPEKAVDFGFMFAASPFHDDISGWNVLETARLRDMFIPAHDFLWPSPSFAAQSMSPWIVRVHLMLQLEPSDPLWAEAFSQVAPLAQGLDLDHAEHARAIVQAHGSIAASQMGIAVEPMVLPENFVQR